MDMDVVGIHVGYKRALESVIIIGHQTAFQSVMYQMGKLKTTVNSRVKTAVSNIGNAFNKRA